MTAPIPRTGISVKEAAESLGVSQKHVHRLLAQGELQSFKSGSRVIIRYDSFVEYSQPGRVR